MTQKTLEKNPLDSQKTKKPNFIQAHKFLLLGSTILFVGGGALGYSVGHRQGLTVVGYEANAEELMEIVQKQKDTLSTLNKNLNMAVQERDVALSNTAHLSHALSEGKADLGIAQTQSQIYRHILRQRGGVSLMVQNLGVRPLPENVFEYQLDLLQVSPRKASGTVELRLIRGGDVLIVPMEDKHFDFESFQRLTGRWTMPKGFTPQFIEVRLNGGLSEIKRFNWLRGKEVESPATFVSDIPQAEAKVQ
ncbi:DUF6776 family protein [Acinetobacter nectaris]|uniref:Uncharacterized protein n=1 Tax=Acinetobacter nectaris CIP 110549 TaxID=1392540 RepID=V2TQ09_9GAMM|nr:DUF6776 family protein [Acinetobacter nectaris]ESK40131.1 hypothetical protein P256_00571 [Acinetobacter nectaris CIP 110549]MCF9034055.1 hypothetical protein [Acinetobacter nectaris]MCF9045396.1 hypothetical protein [Acinetobacter nectaris]